MTPRQRLFRAVNWAFGLSLLTIAFVVFGFCTCPGTSAVISSASVSELIRSRPPDTAPKAEREAWEAKFSEAHKAAYEASGRAFWMAAVFVGVPTTILLVALCVFLHRARVWLRRGA